MKDAKADEKLINNDIQILQILTIIYLRSKNLQCHLIRFRMIIKSLNNNNFNLIKELILSNSHKLEI